MLSKKTPPDQVMVWASLMLYAATPTSRSAANTPVVGIERSMKMLLVSFVTCSRLNGTKKFPKRMRFRYSTSFIVFPGGFGTLDELSEALTLIQTGKIKHFPVILFGKAYWAGFVDWLRDRVLAEGKVSAPDMLLFTVTDDPREAVDIVMRARQQKPDDPTPKRRSTDTDPRDV